MVEYSDYSIPFVECCKRYKLKKEDVFNLLMWYDSMVTTTLKGLPLQDWAEIEEGYLEQAKLLFLLLSGGALSVKVIGGGEVLLKHSRALEALREHLQCEVNRNNYYFLKRILYKDNWKEPFTADELKVIIKYEEKALRAFKTLGGRKYELGEAIPILGGYAESGMIAAPSNMTLTDKYNLVGELMERAGVLATYKNSQGLTKWELMPENDRKNEVKGWINSFKKALDKIPDADSFTIIDFYLVEAFYSEDDYRLFKEMNIYDDLYQSLDW